MKNVSNSTKAPDLGMASFDLYTAKELLEAFVISSTLWKAL